MLEQLLKEYEDKLREEDFVDSNRYAGDKNIAHIVEVAKMFDLSQEEDEQILDKGIFVGVDGCKGGWISA